MKLQFSVEGDFTYEFLAHMQTLATNKTPTVLMFPTQIVIKSVKKGSGGSGTPLSYEELEEIPKGCVVKDKDGDKWFSHGDEKFSEESPSEIAYTIEENTFNLYAPWKLTGEEWC